MRVSETTIIAFADSAAEVAGVALPGAGTLLSVSGELTAASTAQLDGGDTAWTLAAPGAYALSLESRHPGVPLVSGATIWLCSARGTVEGRELDALATIVRHPAEPAALERALAIGFDHELSLAMLARRPGGATEHGDEELEAVVFRGDPPAAVVAQRPLLSSTYGGGGLVRHAGIEVWEEEESEYALRLGGEALTSGEIAHPDGAHSRVVFMAFHSREHRGIGSYTLTTR